MNIGIAIVCRLSSSRLPGKALRQVGGRSVLGHIVDRVRRGANGLPLVVCTSDTPRDDELERFCRWSGLQVFRGPLDDVAGRFLACAEANGLDFAVRINGDNMFLDPDTLRAMVAIASTNEFDFVTNVPGRTFPFGMSVEIVRTSFYRETIANVSDPHHREHVTSWLYDNPECGRRFIYENRVCEAARGLKLAIDTEADLERATRMVARMRGAPEHYGLQQIARFALEEPVADPWLGRHGPVLIAEIGGNHEGNFDVARKLAEQAIATGVDFVKFQLYRGDMLVNGNESPDRNAHFKKFELTRDQHIELAQMCRAAGVGYLASVWDLEMLEWIDEWLTVYKIGSGDLTAWPIVREFAKRGKPMIVSTGLATLEEVLQTVAQIQAANDRYRHPEGLCLLQCTSMYPIPESEANLRVMDTLRAKTGLAVGYSDHTEGGLALRAAAAMGAEVLEFHFTDDRSGKQFRDHKVSLTPAEVLELQEDLQRIVTLRGSGAKEPTHAELENGHVASFRRAVYPGRALQAGDVLAAESLVVLRPNHGIDSRDFDWVAHKSLTRPMGALGRLDYDIVGE